MGAKYRAHVGVDRLVGDTVAVAFVGAKVIGDDAGELVAPGARVGASVGAAAQHITTQQGDEIYIHAHRYTSVNTNTHTHTHKHARTHALTHAHTLRYMYSDT